jgi:hypothetical protein
VALRLLSMFPTSAPTECPVAQPGTLWACLHCCPERVWPRARKLIIFCFDSWAQEASIEDSALVLSVVDDELVDANNHGQDAKKWTEVTDVESRSSALEWPLGVKTGEGAAAAATSKQE